MNSNKDRTYNNKLIITVHICYEESCKLGTVEINEWPLVALLEIPFRVGQLRLPRQFKCDHN